jgi:catechol 2,3-dioxygenase-like lactoylglutathione lyase family enzyme
MHHYCYSIPDYDQQAAARKLRAAHLEPTLEGNRIYFRDPDGLTVQLAAQRRS